MKANRGMNMNKNMMLGCVFERLAADPSGPKEGQIYFNTTTSKFRGYNGSAWVDL